MSEIADNWGLAGVFAECNLLAGAGAASIAYRAQRRAECAAESSLTLQGRAHNGERSGSGQPLQGRRRDARDGSESGVESVGDGAIE